MKRNFMYACLASLSLLACQSVEKELTMVVGTYTDGDSKGIYTFRFNQETGEHIALNEVEVSNPSYLTLSADNQFVYAVSEHGDGREAVNAFNFNKETGALQFINKQETKGADPCYVATNGKNVVTANYSGGNVSVFPIAQDGSLLPAADVVNFVGSGPDKERQASAHLHCALFSPDGKYLFANDLGTDKIYKFNVNQQADGQNGEKFLSLGNPPIFSVKPASGPRHITFTPNGKYAYLLTELSGMVIAFQYEDGNLKEIQSIAADTLNAKGSADIHVSPDGKFVYATNRLQADGLAIFKIDEATGMLTKVGYQLTGIHPRNFIITPNGKYLLVACRDSHVIQVFSRNRQTGLLTDTGGDIKINKPVCIQFAN